MLLAIVMKAPSQPEPSTQSVRYSTCRPLRCHTSTLTPVHAQWRLQREVMVLKTSNPCPVQDTRQLRHIFSHLEENNLFLIQTAQEAEEAAEASTVELNATIAQVPNPISTP